VVGGVRVVSEVTGDQVRPSRHRRRRRIVDVLTTVAFVVALVIASLMLLPAVLGYRRYVIVSGSMEPTIPTGSVVYDEIVPVDELEVGDVITFVPPPEFHISEPVTHRIVDIEIGSESSNAPGEPILTTKGDANPGPDGWSVVLDEPEQPRVAHHLPWVGYVYMALDHRWVQLLVVGVPALVIVVVLLVSLWRLAGDAVREERAEAAA
jgi:signal peptidase I